MSKFDIYLNTEKPAVVEKLIDVYPFAGVCCNPQMVARLGRTDFANIVKELRAATGSRKLFIQTPSNDYDGIMRDAEAILKIAGEPTIITDPIHYGRHPGDAEALCGCGYLCYTGHVYPPGYVCIAVRCEIHLRVLLLHAHGRS